MRNLQPRRRNWRTRRLPSLLTTLTLLVAAAVSPGRAAAPPDYANPATWICGPGVTGTPCDISYDATAIQADGSTSVEPWHKDPTASADCFYVYPMVSSDPGDNSDLLWSMAEEGGVTQSSAGRFGSVCRVFAPVYRSYTLTSALRGIFQLRFTPDPKAFEIAYGDVRAAWRHYLEHKNKGRAVILMGHSEGALMLQRLLKEEIDLDDEVRPRVISAYLIGISVQVPKGKDVGGDFRNMPACRQPDQVGCIISYATYRANKPPFLVSLFGKAAAKGMEALCTNPAALAGGKAWLTPYFPAKVASGSVKTTLPSGPWVDPSVGSIETPFVTLPQFVDASCVARNGYRYLAATVHGDRKDPRVDDPGGDMTDPLSAWLFGWHAMDFALPLGDLVRLAGAQALSYCRIHRGADGCSER